MGHPLFQKSTIVNITEQMIDVEPQMVITKDNLNAEVDAVVYYKIQDVKKSLYNVDDHQSQLVSLARTTLRAVIGQMTFTVANENRDKINIEVEKILDKETDSYGVEVLRVEIQKIEAPQDVQAAMNEVVKAERKKIAAADVVNALEIEADGVKRSEIKKAEGIKQAAILKAEGDSEAIIKLADAEATKIKLESEALKKHFTGNAQIFRQLEVTEKSLEQSTKFVIDPKTKIQTIISDMAGVIPIKQK